MKPRSANSLWHISQQKHLGCQEAIIALMTLPTINSPERYFKKMLEKFSNTKDGFKSEDTEEFFVAKINIPNHYPEQKIQISRLNNLFKFSAKDSDLEYLFWQQKIL